LVIDIIRHEKSIIRTGRLEKMQYKMENTKTANQPMELLHEKSSGFI